MFGNLPRLVRSYGAQAFDTLFPYLLRELPSMEPECQLRAAEAYTAVIVGCGGPPPSSSAAAASPSAASAAAAAAAGLDSKLMIDAARLQNVLLPTCLNMMVRTANGARCAVMLIRLVDVWGWVLVLVLVRTCKVIRCVKR